MKIKDITNYLESLAPLSLQESYDNAGLIVGNPDQEVNGALVCLDSTEEVVDEAISKGVKLILAHHPIVFSGLKKFNGTNYIQRVVMKAIKHDIAIYAAHTNVDNISGGVNKIISRKLGLEQLQILAPKPESMYKLITFVPNSQAPDVMDAIFAAGAGQIGNYAECSFSSSGNGTYRPLSGASPFAGTVGTRHSEEETKVEVVVPAEVRQRVVAALVDAHPYEEVAYDLIALDNRNKQVGAGMIGRLTQEMNEISFLDHLKSALNAGCIRHTRLLDKPIRKVAVCGGSGSFLLPAAKRVGADIFVTSDYKYHQFFDADGDVIIADVGHFESEQYTGEWFADSLREKFPTFAVHFTGVNTNPINYL